MCFVSKKKLNQIQAKIEELTKIVETQELVRLRQIRDMYNNQTDLISDVHFTVKSAKMVIDEKTGDPSILVKYDIPPVKVELDADGKPIKNKMFYAINYLELISTKDMEQIQRELNKAYEFINKAN